MGRVLIHDGERANLNVSSTIGVESDNIGANLGESVVIFDADGDGKGDVFAGAPRFDSNGVKGAVFAWKGTAAGIGSSPTWIQVGTTLNSSFGASIAVGKFRGSTNAPVVAVGAPEDDTIVPALTNNGRVYFFYAGVSGFPANNQASNQSFAGQFAGDLFGSAVSNARTLFNTTGGDAVAIGAPQRTKTPPSISGGYVALYRPVSNAISFVTGIVGNDVAIGCTSGFGSHLADAGNVDGQFRTDLLIGADECENGSGQDNEGRIFMFKSTTTVDAAASVTKSSWTYESNELEAQAGPVAGLGDTNGDGRPDFAVGVPFANTSGVDNGRVLVFHGVGSGTPSLSAAVTMTTSFAGNAGSSLGAADVNLDGVNDLIEGEPSYDETGTANEGRVRVFLGNRNGTMDFSADRTYEGNCANCQLGLAVAGGDVDGDGYGDAVIGRPGRTNGQSKEGDVLLYRGGW